LALPALVNHVGSLSGSPAQTGTTVPSLQELINTSFQGTFGGSKSARLTISGATDLSPFVLSLDTITKVRLIVVRTQNQSLRVKITSAYGATQVIPLSNALIWFAPNAGDEVTAIEFVGTADVEVVIAGDVT
jgi:hypothetical protein